MNGLIALGASLIEKYMTSSDKKEEAASQMVTLLVQTKTYAWVDALVKLAYASNEIVKGLVRPLFSAGLFVYGVMNPDVLAKLHSLGTAGDAGIVTMFSAFPGWMYSRHKTKGNEKKPSAFSDTELYPEDSDD